MTLLCITHLFETTTRTVKYEVNLVSTPIIKEITITINHFPTLKTIDYNINFYQNNLKNDNLHYQSEDSTECYRINWLVSNYFLKTQKSYGEVRSVAETAVKHISSTVNLHPR